jgi:uncharacterized membrane protein HdeD (DUF308 family)
MNSLKRIAYLLKKDVVEIYRPAVLVSATVAGVLLVVSLLICIFGDGSAARASFPQGVQGHDVVFGLLLVLGGALITSRAFSEVHDRSRNHEWFMLPASTLEKFLNRLVLTSVGYSIIVIVGYFAATAITAGITLAVTGNHLGIFNPLDREVWQAVANYWLAQSIFLFGAAYFRKTHFVKTVLSVIVLAISLGIFTAIVLRIVFTGYFDGLEPTAELARLFENFDDRFIWFGWGERLARTLSVIANIIRWGVIGPLFWTLTYFRLRETEVSHGV